MTVKELYAECKSLIEDGLGDREIFVADDEEGNGYHRLFYSFMTDKDELDSCMKLMRLMGAYDQPNSAEDFVVLG